MKFTDIYDKNDRELEDLLQLLTALITNNVESYFIKYFKKKILAMFIYKNIYGVQFHPERSGESGLKLLSKII